MLLAEVPAVVTDIGVAAGTVTATGAAVGMVGRWIRRKVEEEIEPVREELSPNHGKSLRDRVDCISADVTELRTQSDRNSGRLDRIEGRLMDRG